MSLPPVEDVLGAADADLARKYRIIKDQLLGNLQTRWASRWPEGNDHGPGHVERVLDYLAQLVGADPIGRKRLTAFELFLAATAVVAHDIGVIDGRKGHPARSAELLAELAATNTFLFDAHSLEVLGAAVVSHGSDRSIEEGCEGLSEVETFVGHDVRPRLIAALVRLADELDEDRRRGLEWVQKAAKIPETSEPYWEFCQRVQGIRLDASDIVFDVCFEPKDAGRIVTTKDGTESFLRFFARKVAKINREREGMKPYLGEMIRQRILVTAKGVPGRKQPHTFVFSNGMCATPAAEKEAVESFVGTFAKLDAVSEPTKAPVVRAESNVFVVGPVIDDPRRFFGRTALFKEFSRLWTRPPFQNAAVIGPSRSGKTSLLRHLLHLAASPPGPLRPDQQGPLPAALQGYRLVFVNFQDPRLSEPEGVLRHILSGLGIPSPSPCTPASFYDAVVKGLKTPSLVLLDEIGVAISDYAALDRRFWDTLRALGADMDVDGRLAFLLASHEPPYALSESSGKTSSFFNTFGFTERLGPLTEAEARQLAESAQPQFSRADVDWIVNKSRWPIKIQALCRARLSALEGGEEGDGWRERGLQQMERWSFLPEAP
jgi:hypothetical protein